MHDRARLENKMHEKSCTKHDWIFSTISNPGPDQQFCRQQDLLRQETVKKFEDEID